MSNEIIITENQQVNLTEELSAKFIAAKLIDPSLPFNIIDNTIIFEEYTVGTIQISDITIKIKPRNKSFDLKNIFEMVIYTDYSFLKEEEISGFGFSNGFGINVLIKQFISEVKRLCDFGLTGSYTQKYIKDRIIYGNINCNSFHRKSIPFNGIESEKNEYGINIVQNAIIKSALKKCLKYIKENKLRTEIILMMNNFLDIDDYYGDLAEDIVKIKNFYSPNKFYPICLEISLKILQDLKLIYLESNLTFQSFLFNSNDIFEKYIRTILKRNLDINISKLDTNTVQIALINHHLHEKTESLNKYVSPDILVNYEKESNKALAILDVKNKDFNLSGNGNYSNLISSPDLYQIIVYCLKFKTEIAGLIYPSDKDIKPISFFVDIGNSLNIYLLSINMQDTLVKRHKKIISIIKKYIISSL